VLPQSLPHIILSRAACINIVYIFEDIYPLALNVSKFEVTIQNMDESADVTYDVYFTPKIHDCIDPAISFIYEGIDYDQMDEYINITDKHGGLIR